MRSFSFVRTMTLSWAAATLVPIVLASQNSRVRSASKSDRTIEFDTDEGTRMCVDVSPDGRTIVFDLLGDLYTLPISGGRATPLSSGKAWDRCPRYSPDAKYIAFASDRVQRENLWLLDLTSKKFRQLTDLPLHDIGDRGATGTPSWLPGGREVAYTHSPTVRKSRISVVGVDGGSSRVLELSRVEQSSVTFAQSGSRAFVVLTDSATRRATIHGFDLDSKSLEPFTTASRDTTELRPILSSTGRLLAYIRGTAPYTHELRVRDLATGSDRGLMPITHAGDIAGFGEDEPPGFAFTPDEQSIVIWNDGKLHRVSVATGAVTPIPFSVHVVREVAPLVRAHYRISDASMSVRSIRWPTITPDGRTLIFSAVGYLWTMKLPNGTPSRLTRSDDYEFMPALSPDGKQLAYVEYNYDPDLIKPPGRLVIRRMDTGEKQVISDSALYWIPSWSPDGTKLALIREIPKGSNVYQNVAQYGWIDLANKQFTPVAATRMNRGDQRYIMPLHVVFAQNGTELMYVHAPGGVDWNVSLRSVKLDGSNMRELITGGPDISGFFPSPDMSTTAVLAWDYNAYLAPLPREGEPTRHVTIQDPTEKAKLTRVSRGGALYPRWTDSRTLLYAWTTAMFRYRVGDATGTSVGRVALSMPRRGGSGVFAFRGARLITVDGTRGAGHVFDTGTIVVRDRRIVAVGPSNKIRIPDGATVIDGTGLTIVPGFIETHGHGFEEGSFPGTPVRMFNTVLGGLSYGFTTAWEATGRTADDAQLARNEMQDIGRTRGGRWFGAIGRFTMLEPHGVPYRTREEVQNAVQRKVELGGEQCLKNYYGKYRAMAQWFAEAAREAGVCVVAHVGYPGQLLSRATDGYSMDHPALWSTAYRDVIQYLARTGAIWTPHHNFSNGNVHWRRMILDTVRNRFDENAFRKMERYASRDYATQADDAPGIPWENTRHGRFARLTAQIMAAGGKIAASTDAMPPFDNHVQLWSFVYGGMPIGDALRTATMIPAEKIAVQADLGSLEVGKLADFLVLTANPLERIENTIALRYVVLAGLIHDSETLNVIPPTELKKPR
jgi:Tol biopolymer transport system component